MGIRDFFHEVFRISFVPRKPCKTERFRQGQPIDPRNTPLMGVCFLQLLHTRIIMPLVLFIALLIRFERRAQEH